MPRGGARKGAGQPRKNLKRVSVGITQEMHDKGLTDAKSVRDAALKYKKAVDAFFELGCEARGCADCNMLKDCPQPVAETFREHIEPLLD